MGNRGPLLMISETEESGNLGKFILYFRKTYLVR